MGLRLHVVRDVVPKYPMQARRVRHDHVIEGLTSDRTNNPLNVRVLPRRSRRRTNGLEKAFLAIVVATLARSNRDRVDRDDVRPRRRMGGDQLSDAPHSVELAK